MHAEIRERIFAAMRTIAREARDASQIAIGQPDDVILLLKPWRSDEDHARALTEIIGCLTEKNFLTAQQCLGPNGIAGALIPHAVASGCGFSLDLSESEGSCLLEALFMETREPRALVTTRPKAHLPLSNFVDRRGGFSAEAIGRITSGMVRIRWMGETVLELSSAAQLLA